MFASGVAAVVAGNVITIFRTRPYGRDTNAWYELAT